MAAGNAAAVDTYWRVKQPLDGRESLAYFVPIATDVPQVIQGQYDAGTWRSALEAGNVIMQHARVALSPDMPPWSYQVRLGLCAPDTNQRSIVRGPNGATADHVLLPTVEVIAP